MEDVTLLLDRMKAGEPGAENRLVEAVYQELRQMAGAKMAREPHQTLQPTALVNEAYMRLGEDQTWENRRHFFAAASEAMRRVLIDRARGRRRAKRGGGELPAEFLEEVHVSPEKDGRLILIHEVIEALEEEDPLKAEIVKLRFFVGLSNQEIGTIFDLNEKTIRRHWNVAKVRLFQLISEGNEE